MSEQSSDNKGCVGCVALILVLGAAGYFFGPDLLAWDRNRIRTNKVDEPSEKALARVPEFLAARRLKGELLAKMRAELDFTLWDPPDTVKEPPLVGTLAGRVVLWQERSRGATATKTPPIAFKWHFDLEIDTIGTPLKNTYSSMPRIRRTLPHADEIRARIEAELPPTLRLAPDSFTVIHQEDDVRPASLFHVIPPKGKDHAHVRALLWERGLADADATLPEVRFVVVRAVTTSSLVGRYTDGVSARSGTIKATFFLMPSQACLGTHTVRWSPPRTKGRGSFDAIRAARSRFDTWLQKTHGYEKTRPFFPEMEPVPKPKPKPKPKKKRR